MTRFLASVRDGAEAEAALAAGADIVDLKDPGKGALGALAPDAIASCVGAIAGRAELSATVGDLPMVPDMVRSAVLATAATGVDYVKLGLFPGGDARGCLDLLAEEARGVRLILVVFADAPPGFDAIRAAARIGASGVMLDTTRKDGRSLLDHLPLDRLADFVAAARAEGLLVGLAGSLKSDRMCRRCFSSSPISSASAARSAGMALAERPSTHQPAPRSARSSPSRRVQPRCRHA